MSIIRFKAENEKPRRMRVKIAVAADDEGNWCARGASWLDGTINELLEEEEVDGYLDGDAQQRYWLVVDIPLPATEVLASQSDDDE